MTSDQFHDALKTYCALLQASVTSYGRTRTHNGLVGGVAMSAHLFWLAADVVYDSKWPSQYRSDMAARLGLKLIIENDHDHLQPREWLAG